MVRNEWKRLLHNPILVVVLIAIIAIPTIYTTLFLGSMWDPYGKLDQLPVAVVNQDQAVDYDGTELKVGENLLDNLKENRSLDFDFVDAKEAQDGLEAGDYYMVITIPEDFSKNASTLMDEKPVQMTLQYKTNPGKNYIAAKMSESALEKIKNAVSAEVTKTYAQTMFDQIAEVGSGMKDAADGAGKIDSGVEDLAEGNKEIQKNLELLASSTLTFSDGSETLQKGLKEYTDGVVQADSGAAELASGAKQLNSGSTELVNGVSTLNTGITQLANGTVELNDNTGTLTSGVNQLLKGAKDLQKGTSALAKGTSEYVSGTKTLANGVTAYVDGAQKLADGAKQLSGLQSLSQVSDGINALYKGVNTGDKDTPSLISAAESLKNGLYQMRQQVGQLAGSFSEDSIRQLTTGLQAAKKGIGDAAAGIQAAGDGMQTAISGIQQGKTLLQTGAGAVNAQANAVNQQFSQKAAAANDQIDAAIAAIQDAVKNGAVDEKTAADSIAALQESKIETEEIPAVEVPAQVTGGLTQIEKALGEGAEDMKTGAESLKTGAAQLEGMADQIPVITGNPMEQLVTGLDQAYAGATAIHTATKTVGSGLTTLKEGTKDFPTAGQGMTTLLKGFQTLTKNNAALIGGAEQLKKSSNSLETGAKSAAAGAEKLATGGATLSQGATKLVSGISAVNSGALQLKEGVKSLMTGVSTLHTGTDALQTGTMRLVTGTKQLVANNEQLLSGANQLNDGAGQIHDGAEKLADGSGTLGEGIDTLHEGSTELAGALSDGQKEVEQVKANDDTYNMFAKPVEAEESMEAPVENNGHAMAAYMMSVALWVACIAFCIMYPLTQYSGQLKSGFTWWFSKATVVYPLTIIMGFVMLGMLHWINGFNPADWGRTIAVTVLASVAFMSIMYFFNVWLGKVGSFIMLVFMVVQLAGSAGTYPIELSGEFVSKIHNWLPFSYTVNAFRGTISGSGDITHAVLVLTAMIVVFTILTILMFQIRAKRLNEQKPLLFNFLEENGLA